MNEEVTTYPKYECWNVYINGYSVPQELHTKPTTVKNAINVISKTFNVNKKDIIGFIAKI